MVAYDIAGRTMTTLTQAFTLDSELAVPGLASSDGASIYAQTLTLAGVGPDQRGTVVPGELSRFGLTTPGTMPFTWESTFPMDSQPTLVTPPLAADNRYVFFGQVGVVGGFPWSGRPTSQFYLYRAVRSTLQPIGFERIIVDNNPTGFRGAPVVGLSTGLYTWPPPNK